MKYLKFVIIVFALYFLGYILGPILGPMMVKEQEVGRDFMGIAEYKGAQYKINLADFDDGDFPKTLKIVKTTKIPTLSGEGEVILKKGDQVTLLSRDSSGLMVEKRDSNGKGLIKPADTDVFKQFAKKIYDKESPKGEKESVVAKATELPEKKGQNMLKEEAKVVAKTEKTQTPTPQTAPQAAVTEEKKAMVETETTPEPEVAVNGDLSDDEIVALMKKSIQANALKEFTFDQVGDWSVEGKETIDGTEYQIGQAAYEASTIFGVRSVKAKALIKSGKIERWVFAKSGMEIQ